MVMVIRITITHTTLKYKVSIVSAGMADSPLGTLIANTIHILFSMVCVWSGVETENVY